jgi:hypothetical protein
MIDEVEVEVDDVVIEATAMDLVEDLGGTERRAPALRRRRKSQHQT